MGNGIIERVKRSPQLLGTRAGAIGGALTFTGIGLAVIAFFQDMSSVWEVLKLLAPNPWGYSLLVLLFIFMVNSGFKELVKREAASQKTLSLIENKLERHRNLVLAVKERDKFRKILKDVTTINDSLDKNPMAIQRLSSYESPLEIYNAHFSYSPNEQLTALRLNDFSQLECPDAHRV